MHPQLNPAWLTALSLSVHYICTLPVLLTLKIYMLMNTQHNHSKKKPFTSASKTRYKSKQPAEYVGKISKQNYEIVGCLKEETNKWKVPAIPYPSILSRVA